MKYLDLISLPINKNKNKNKNKKKIKFFLFPLLLLSISTLGSSGLLVSCQSTDNQQQQDIALYNKSVDKTVDLYASMSSLTSALNDDMVNLALRNEMSEELQSYIKDPSVTEFLYFDEYSEYYRTHSDDMILADVLVDINLVTRVNQPIIRTIIEYTQCESKDGRLLMKLDWSDGMITKIERAFYAPTGTQN
jgi:hypothetical protein